MPPDGTAPTEEHDIRPYEDAALEECKWLGDGRFADRYGVYKCEQYP